MKKFELKQNVFVMMKNLDFKCWADTDWYWDEEILLEHMVKSFKFNKIERFFSDKEKKRSVSYIRYNCYKIYESCNGN